MSKLNWRIVRRILFDYALLTVGAALLALNIDFFLVPNRIVSGGVTGIATILHYALNVPVGTLVLVLNIPLFIAGVRWGGGMRFAVRTIYATVLMSVLADLLVPWVATLPPIQEPLL